ncbi:heavy metal translocating P-type ATPase [Chelatococcus composti]|nr:heavy metal translocating P-type ATPase [Chelatococcus composti]
MARLRPFLVLVAVLGLAGGFVLRFLGHGDAAPYVWAAATVPVLGALVAEIVTSLRRGDVGLDIVAALSMSGALALGETLAGAVVALMYAGGQYLEFYAEGRARREMRALLSRVPRSALRYDGEGRVVEVPLSDVRPGERLLIRQGDVLPVDGRVIDEAATIDQSAITGESVPVHLSPGREALSGTTNIGAAFDLLVLRPAAASTYAGIVRLVEEAQKAKAPMTRLADRYAIAFLAATVLLAGAAWFLSGDPVRALAVLVVATPCPLILAVPVALVAGLSQAARHGVLIKGGGALEALSQARTAVLDKTGTLTFGRARLVDVRVFASTDGEGDADEALRLAASLDQASAHVVAEALIEAAEERGLALSAPHDVRETAGRGLSGRVEGRMVAVGSLSYVGEHLGGALPWIEGIDGRMTAVAVAVDGRLRAVLLLADLLRPDAAALLARLGEEGVSRLILASGDRSDIVAEVAAGLPLSEAHGDLTPEDKLAIVRQERRKGAGAVMMIGDGINDAPALAEADVGIAVGARGASASAEAANVVLLVDGLKPVADALLIARRSRRIALQSVYVGIGLSGLGMLAAAAGFLAPVQGALLQEAIDVAAIMNALRALASAPGARRSAPDKVS